MNADLRKQREIEVADEFGFAMREEIDRRWPNASPFFRVLMKNKYRDELEKLALAVRYLPASGYQATEPAFLIDSDGVPPWEGEL